MFKIGCHLSSAKGYLNMGKEAQSIGANTFQYFSRNPRGSKAKTFNAPDAAALQALLVKDGFGPLMVHAPYTMNACSADPALRELALQMMTDDLAMIEHLPGNFYNFHPGSHGKQGTEAGISLIAQMLNKILKPEQSTLVLLETMAGKGNEIGGSFEELRAVLDQIDLKEKTGVCLDTCHVFDAGYDIVDDLPGVLAHFDAVIGLDKLYAIHLNDSLNALGSHKDRHACIGKGSIGSEALVQIINHPKLRELPFLLETPNDLAGYAAEISLLRQEYSEK